MGKYVFRAYAVSKGPHQTAHELSDEGVCCQITESIHTVEYTDIQQRFLGGWDGVIHGVRIFIEDNFSQDGAHLHYTVFALSVRTNRSEQTG